MRKYLLLAISSLILDTNKYLKTQIYIKHTLQLCQSKTINGIIAKTY